ncbi:hypothetical protein CQ12_06140 [Bradyrhizobium jicamae]|uniref:Uncharacterized protein n=1 Tax=Bradyrhizobium jicamae TaxID=280332 RepID=A0A0R3LY05_9BRAD|nr:hypothetical protein [Bradyrhizobium jicamae]KRR09987.1 hypothetical protein CQ12_06140 [Bradyrhizobium jicamae]
MNAAQSLGKHVAIVALALVGPAVLLSAIPTDAQELPSLEQLLTKEEQAKLGVTSMSPEKREVMRGALIRTFRQGYRAAQSADRPGGAGTGTSVVETQVDGEFNGWEGETIIKLMNDQIWQQTEYHYEYRYAYMPKVLIYPSGGGHKMRVDGTSKPIGVQRLR